MAVETPAQQQQSIKMIQHYQQQVYAQQQEQQQQQFDNSSSKPLRPQERDIFIIHSPLNLHPLLIPRQARRLSYLLAIPNSIRTEICRKGSKHQNYARPTR